MYVGWKEVGGIHRRLFSKTKNVAQATVFKPWHPYIKHKNYFKLIFIFTINFNIYKTKLELCKHNSFRKILFLLWTFFDEFLFQNEITLNSQFEAI